jgi:hypothetical protein
MKYNILNPMCKAAIKLLPSILIFILLITIPMLKLNTDMWDGTSISYANDINNYKGIYIYFFESNWFLQYPLSLGIIKLSHLFNLEYKDFNAIFVLIVMIIILNETKKFAIKIFNFNNHEIYLLLNVLITFPVWGVLLSSIMTFHLLCMCLGLIAVRMIHSDKTMLKILGFILLLISFNYQSLLLFLPVLSSFYDQNNSSKKSNIFISINTVWMFILAIFFYITFSIFFPPNGTYKNYNSISLFSLTGIKYAIFSIIGYGTYFLPLLLIIIFLFFFVKYLPTYFVRNTSKFNLDPKLFLLLFLIMASIMPYIAVGKNSFIWDVKDWNSRQAFPLAFPFAFLSIYVLKFTSKYYVFKYKKIANFLVFVLLTINFSFLLVGVVEKINRDIFFTRLQNQIRINKKFLPPGGIVQIVCNEIPKPFARNYEVNYLMYKATTKANWWSRIDKQVDTNFNIPINIINNINYQNEYVYIHDSQNIHYNTLIYVTVLNYDGFKNALNNIFIKNNNSKLKINKILIYKYNQ